MSVLTLVLDLAGPGLAQLCKWFQDTALPRPDTFVVCRGAAQGLAGLLLALLADRVLVTKDVTFDTTNLPLVVYSCMNERFGVRACGRLCLTESMPAARAVEIGLASSVISSMDELNSKVHGLTRRTGFQEKCSLSEALVRDAEELESMQDKTAKLKPIQWLDGIVAHIQLTSAIDLRQHLAELATSEMSGILIEDVGVSVESNKGFLAEVRELYAITVVQRRIRELRVPVCVILGGTASALGTVVALAADHCIGLDEVCFDFTDPEVARLVFDVADSIPATLGPAKAESLRIQRRVVDATEASHMGLLTSTCMSRGAAVHNALTSLTQQPRHNKAVLPRCVDL